MGGGAEVRLHELTKTYGPVVAVRDVSATIAAGSFFTLLGPSGSGKGTIAHRLASLLGFHVLDSGSLYRLLALADTQPLQYGFEPAAWKLADEQLAEVELVAIFGANRTTKSWWAAKRFCEAAWKYPGGVCIALSEKDESSIATQQQWVWFYLRHFLEKLNNKRNTIYKVNYTQANGFTDGKLVLPNRTEIYFLTYKTTATAADLLLT